MALWNRTLSHLIYELTWKMFSWSLSFFPSPSSIGNWILWWQKKLTKVTVTLKEMRTANCPIFCCTDFHQLRKRRKGARKEWSFSFCFREVRQGSCILFKNLVHVFDWVNDGNIGPKWMTKIESSDRSSKSINVVKCEEGGETASDWFFSAFDETRRHLSHPPSHTCLDNGDGHEGNFYQSWVHLLVKNTTVLNKGKS